MTEETLQHIAQFSTSASQVTMAREILELRAGVGRLSDLILRTEAQRIECQRARDELCEQVMTLYADRDDLKSALGEALAGWERCDRWTAPSAAGFGRDAPRIVEIRLKHLGVNNEKETSTSD